MIGGTKKKKKKKKTKWLQTNNVVKGAVTAAVGLAALKVLHDV